MRLVQIIDDGIEELYEITDKALNNKTIKKYWQDYQKSNEDSFEDWLEQHSLKGIERVFVDEIHI